MGLSDIEKKKVITIENSMGNRKITDDALLEFLEAINGEVLRVETVRKYFPYVSSSRFDNEGKIKNISFDLRRRVNRLGFEITFAHHILIVGGKREYGVRFDVEKLSLEEKSKRILKERNIWRRMKNNQNIQRISKPNTEKKAYA